MKRHRVHNGAACSAECFKTKSVEPENQTPETLSIWNSRRACEARIDAEMAQASGQRVAACHCCQVLFEVSLVTGCHRISGSWAGSALDGGTFALGALSYILPGSFEAPRSRMQCALQH